ncbi:hypothetical protein [Pararcticibacter amylolyticus]|uniref:Uncharacterized protein n=1 Tax=Pararcticibacter amylolyticus TaxID=2173175 RepID=A0A2U2PLH8_9SPHI|nr:hypothetical protein [Pararcticibacter amylolyticus]PWG82251.1 hypothetical protein DDR33_04375 [Pararcticibacter amylolyticus]
MKPGEALIKILSRKYDPLTLINSHFKRYDISFKTDQEGNPVLLFIGKATPGGTIKGERYARTLKKDTEGNVIKDHWELKGKAS